MADRVVFCMWNKAVPGREAAASASFRDAVAYCQRLQEAGEIESHDEVFLDPFGGLGGFMLVKGQGDKLARLLMAPEWLQMCIRGNATMDGFGVVGGTTGEAVPQLLEMFVAAAKG
jgi:hypothetical protein